MKDTDTILRCIVSVLGKDRPGIVAHVASCLSNKHVNINDIKQSILNDIFAMTMLVSVDTHTTTFNDLQDELEQVARNLGVEIRIQRQDIFDSMYKI